MIGLLAAVVAIHTFREFLRGKLALPFVDSESVASGTLVLELSCSVYIDRAPTDTNPADNPSAGHHQAFCFPVDDTDIWSNHLIRDDGQPSAPSAAASRQVTNGPVDSTPITQPGHGDVCRPCVDGGLYSGRCCDGLLDQGMCVASDRVPPEIWAQGQSIPLCTPFCPFCRGVPWFTPPAPRCITDAGSGADPAPVGAHRSATAAAAEADPVPAVDLPCDPIPDLSAASADPIEEFPPPAVDA